MKNISQGKLNKLKIATPPVEEQKEIALRLHSLDSNLAFNAQHLSRLKKLKRGLLQDLLTGKVRVNTLDLPALLNAEAPAEAQAE